MLALAFGALNAPSAFADPSITYTGDVSPAPTSGTTNWTPGADVNIGNTADGTLTISGGATLDASGKTVTLIPYNQSTGNTGTLTIDGAGTKFDAENLYVVVYTVGTGNAIVSGGATVNISKHLDIGLGNFSVVGTANGTVEITGVGTSLTAGGINVGLGSNSKGALFVKDGAKLIAQGFMSVGNAAPAIGQKYINVLEAQNEVLVTGEGSSLEVLGDLSIGIAAYDSARAAFRYNSNVITLADGGHISAGGAFGIRSGSVLNIGAAAGDTAVAAGTLDAAKGIAMGDRIAGAPAATINFNHTGETTFAGSVANFHVYRSISRSL